jgi:hypothetical protein
LYLCLQTYLIYVILVLSLHAQESSMNGETKDLIFSVFEVSLETQLRAVRRLRHGEGSPAEPRRREGLSQVSI